MLYVRFASCGLLSTGAGKLLRASSDLSAAARLGSYSSRVSAWAGSSCAYVCFSRPGDRIASEAYEVGRDDASDQR